MVTAIIFSQMGSIRLGTDFEPLGRVIELAFIGADDNCGSAPATLARSSMATHYSAHTLAGNGIKGRVDLPVD